MSHKSRKKKQRRRHSAEGSQRDEPRKKSGQSNGPNEKPTQERVNTVLRLNTRFLVASLVVCAVCVVIVHFVHGHAVEANTEGLLDLANTAEEEGRSDDAIRLLTQYVRIQSTRDTDDEDSISSSELTDQYVRLGNMLDNADASSDRLLRVYRTFEEVLRRDPERVEIRRRVVDISMLFGRFGVAVDHIEMLIENTTAIDDSTLAELLLQQGQCNFALGNYPDAQKQLLESISHSRDDADAYLYLAAFWVENPGRLIDDDDPAWLDQEQFVFLRPALPFLRPALPGVDRVESDGVKSAFALIDLMANQVQPTAEAHLRRAQFLSQMRPSRDSFPLTSEVAAATAADALEAADEDQNGFLDGDELWHSHVPPLADVNADGRIERAELVKRLMGGDTLARLQHAEDSVLAAEAGIQQEQDDESDSFLSEVLLTAADIYLDLAQASQLEEFEAAQLEDTSTQRRENRLHYTAEAARFAQQGRELEDPDPRFYLTSARLEMQRVGDTDVAAHLERLNLAESLLREGLDLQLEGAGSSPEQADRQNDMATSDVVRLDLQWTLADLLYSQASLQDNTKAQETRRRADEILGELRQEDVPQELLQFLAARDHLVNQNWLEARDLLVSVSNSLDQGSDLWRRSILLLAHCFEQLNNPDAKLNLYRVALRSDPLWQAGLLGEADALVNLGRIDEGVAKYQQLVAIPGVYERLSALYLLQQLRLPAERRNWSRVENALDDALQESPDSHQVATLRAEVLWQRAAALWEQATNESSESTQAATALLDEGENLLRDHRDTHAEVSEAWSPLVMFAARRFDHDASTRLARAEQTLEQAVEQLGDSAELRLAAAQVVTTQPADRIVELLDGLADDTAEFSEEDRYRIHATMARVYTAAGQPDLALQCWEQAADLQLQNLTPRVAILQLLFDQMRTSTGATDADTQSIIRRWESHFDDLESLEGPGGPLGAVFRAQRVISDAVRNEDLQADSIALAESLEEPRQLLEEAEDLRPYWSSIPRVHGSIEALLGNEELAIAHFERAIALGDRSTTVLGTVMQYYHRIAFTATSSAAASAAREKAARLVDMLNEQNPAHLSGSLGRLAAQVLRYSQQRDRAIGLQQSILEASDEPQDRITLAVLRLEAILADQDAGTEEQEQEQEFAAVESLLKEAVQLGPELPNTWTALVEFYVRRSRADDAEQAIQDAAENLPVEPPHLIPFTLGQCHELLAATRGLPTEDADRYRDLAEEHYQQALDADPGNAGLEYAVAGFFSRSSNPDQAIGLLDQLLDPSADIGDDARTQALITKAINIASRGSRPDTEQALELLKTVDAPDDSWQVRIWRAEASILDRRNGPGDAAALLQVLERIADIDSLSPRERFLVAALHDLGAENWDTARSIYEELRREFPDDAGVLAALIHGLLRRAEEGNNLADAQAFFDQFRLLEPNSYRTHSIEARLAAAEGTGDEAAGRLAEFVRQQLVNRPAEELIEQVDLQNLPELSRHLSDVARAQEDDAALKVLERISRSLRQGDTESAAADLQSLGQAQWLVAEMRTELMRQAAVLLEQLEHMHLAEDLYREFADESARSEAVLALAQFLARQGQYAEALNLCEQHWDAIPVQTVAGTALGVLRRGKLEEPHIVRIAPRLEQAVADEDDDARRIALLQLLADLRDYQQRYDHAQAAYMQILGLSANHVIALNNLAWLSARLGQPLPALEWIDLAIETAGPYPELLDTKGVVLIAAGQAADAVKVLQQAADERPLAEIYFHLAEAQWRNGDHSAASDALAKAQENGLDPQSLHPLDRAEYDRLTQALFQR